MLGKLSSLTEVVNSLREHGVRERQHSSTQPGLRRNRYKITLSQNSYKAKREGGQSDGRSGMNGYQMYLILPLRILIKH